MLCFQTYGSVESNSSSCLFECRPDDDLGHIHREMQTIENCS